MTIGSHQSAIGKSQSHCTPRWILDRLGPFDLDPAAADPRPWDCAVLNIAEPDDGLNYDWGNFRVFLNPPFDRRVVGRFMDRMAGHGNGIALLHVRPETEWFQAVWTTAKGILFLQKRVKFILGDGTEQPYNSGAPVCLVAYGDRNLQVLKDCGIEGALVTDWRRNRPAEPAKWIREDFIK